MFTFSILQSASTILLIRPSGFGFNNETAASNAFQEAKSPMKAEDVQQKALAEFSAFEQMLKDHGVNVITFNDTPYPPKPDAIFPNNWVTFHRDGTVVLYPMATPGRRAERRTDIIELLRRDYEIKRVIDMSIYEKDNRFLEGTGSVVFDHNNRFAYACLSPRTNKDLFVEFSKELGYHPVYFHAHDLKGREIYHTNVMMSIAEKIAVVCLDSIKNQTEKQFVHDILSGTDHQIIEISLEQMRHFAGNMLAVKTASGSEIMVMSKNAFNSLNEHQKPLISQYYQLVYTPLPVIENTGGGSARCMMAEVFLPKKR